MLSVFPRHASRTGCVDVNKPWCSDVTLYVTDEVRKSCRSGDSRVATTGVLACLTLAHRQKLFSGSRPSFIHRGTASSRSIGRRVLLRACVEPKIFKMSLWHFIRAASSWGLSSFSLPTSLLTISTVFSIETRRICGTCVHETVSRAFRGTLKRTLGTISYNSWNSSIAAFNVRHRILKLNSQMFVNAISLNFRFSSIFRSPEELFLKFCRLSYSVRKRKSRRQILEL